jgi:hypothetical protein
LHPPKLILSEDVNLCELARKFELIGGHIKNAWLSAIGQMVQRGGDTVTQQDLIQACSDQVIGRLSLEEFDQRVVATCGIDKMVVSVSVKESLESIVQYTQAQTVLFGSWGFESVHRANTGVSALFCGPPGTIMMMVWFQRLMYTITYRELNFCQFALITSIINVRYWKDYGSRSNII